MDGTLHQCMAWSLMRHLLDETKTNSYQQNHRAQVMHEAEKSLGKEKLTKKLKTKYIPQTDTERHPRYTGAPNEKLYQDITTPQVAQATRKLNKRSTAGPDGILNKTLKNLHDSSIEALTKYYKCSQSNKLPETVENGKNGAHLETGLTSEHRKTATHLALGESPRARAG